MDETPTLHERVDSWCAGRNAWVRAPLLLLVSWAWMRHSADPTYRSLFSGLNLGVHELGHFVFGPLGDLTGALGGSLLQCVLPIVGMVMFARQKDLFAIAVAWAWLGTNLFEVATYAGDAVLMQLPLVTPGGGHAIHDWNYVLGAKGWLRHTEAIETAFRGAAQASMMIGGCGAAWLVGRMIVLREEVAEVRPEEIYPRATEVLPWSEPVLPKPEAAPRSWAASRSKASSPPIERSVRDR